MKNLTRIFVAIAVLFLTVVAATPALAAGPPLENPDAAPTVFSGIALLNYDTECLDLVLSKDQPALAAHLSKFPFANIPDTLQEATAAFSSSSANVSSLIGDIDRSFNEVKSLVGQSRLDEAKNETNGALSLIGQAEDRLNQLQAAVQTTGQEFNVDASPEGSSLRQSYLAVNDRITRIRDTLELYRSLFSNLWQVTLGQFTGAGNIDVGKYLASQETIPTYLAGQETLPAGLVRSTSLSLAIQPAAAFVGDDIAFSGVLAAGAEALPGRTVSILAGGAQYATAVTDSQGQYAGTLKVPYWYVDSIDLEALYYPQDQDQGKLLAALSPVTRLQVLFYKTGLQVSAGGKAYPGRSVNINAQLDYGSSPAAAERKIEIHLDQDLFSGRTVGKAFSYGLEIPAGAETGEHTLTVSCPADGRYAGAVVTTNIDVERAVPVLDLAPPGVAFIPLGAELSGRLRSEIGPLDGARVTAGLGNEQVTTPTAPDGGFQVRIGRHLNLGLFGSQDLTISVAPRDPWNSPLSTTKRVVVVNVLNCSLMLAVIALASVYLPGRVIGKPRLSLKKPAPVLSVSESPQPVSRPAVSTGRAVSEGESGKERGIVFWYRRALLFVQSVTRVLLRPNQTVREYAHESSQKLGPVAGYFMQLTAMVEKSLYSRHIATSEETREGERLSSNIEEGSRIEST